MLNYTGIVENAALCTVPLSWDKGRSTNTGTNSSVPGGLRTKSLSQKKPKNRKRTF
jgi:hypothetical protein